MAKMFYTIEETAEKLGVSVDDVKEMAASGKLQQFRDRDKLMFKRDQVDSAAASANAMSGGQDSGPIPMSDSADTDAITLDDTAKVTDQEEDPKQKTGVSVFDADEVEHADPSAQTLITRPEADEEELALESVGSGSGLLDLTRESDDTSLGAELLDEIYPGGGEGSDAKLETAVGSSGVFDGAVTIEATPSGLDNLQQEPAAAAQMVTYVDSGEVVDPVASGLASGALFGALVALFVAMIVVVSAIADAPSAVTSALVGKSDSVAMDPGTLQMYIAVLLGVCVVFAVIGWVVGRMFKR